MKEKEFYSKVRAVAGAKFVVEDASDRAINLTEEDKFSCNLALLLARDKEAVAVRLVVKPESSLIFISKNGEWLERDNNYIKKIRDYLINISKHSIPLDDMANSNDVRNLHAEVLKYCSAKINSRFKKLRDIILYEPDKYIVQSFIKFTSIDVHNMDKLNTNEIPALCYMFYKTRVNLVDSKTTKLFIERLKKVGSYFESLTELVKCALKEQYKNIFSNMKLVKLDPNTDNKYIFSWKNIIKQFIPDLKEYENFKEAYLENYIKKYRLELVYGVDKDEKIRLDFENIKQRVCLHAEMNILTNIINHNDKTRAFIAVSKQCCYLCKLYIQFANNNGYNVVVSGGRKKIFHAWKFPDIKDAEFRNESMSYMINHLDLILMDEIKKFTNLKRDSENDDIKYAVSVDFYKSLNL